MKIFQTAIFQQRIIINAGFITFFINFNKGFQPLLQLIFFTEQITVIFLTNYRGTPSINIFSAIGIRNDD